MKMRITFKSDIAPGIEHIIERYNYPEINSPTSCSARNSRVYANSSLVVTAWHRDKLVGITRSLTDFCSCCYLSELAIGEGYNHEEIGRRMIDITKEIVTKQLIGEQSMLLFLAAPSALEYYSKIELEKVNNGFIIKKDRQICSEIVSS